MIVSLYCLIRFRLNFISRYMVLSVLAVETDAAIRITNHAHLKAFTIFLLAIGFFAFAPGDMDGIAFVFLLRQRALLFLQSKKFRLKRMRISISYTQSLFANELFVLFEVVTVVASARIIAVPPRGKTFTIHFEAFGF